MMKGRGPLRVMDSQPPSPSGSEEEDEARSPLSDDGRKSPVGASAERGRKGMKGLAVFNDELKRDPLDIVH